MRFRDRVEAGRKLAAALAEYQGKEVVVYAIPRGGVVLGAEIAKALDAPLDLIIVRKVGHPQNPEYALCVVTENKQMVCDEAEAALVNKEELAETIAAERAEARRRREVYLAGRAPVAVVGKTAILVDDGVATGLTFIVALRELAEKKPKEIVAALPVLPEDAAEKIKAEGAKLVALEIAKDYAGAVGAYYEVFPQLLDEEVIRLLKQTQEGR